MGFNSGFKGLTLTVKKETPYYIDKYCQSEKTSRLIIVSFKVQDIADCTRYCRLYKILHTVQDIADCTRYCRLYKILQTVQDIADCTRYCRLLLSG